MAKATKETKTNGELDSVSKIEAIKNLIFGENIQQYDSEFEKLKAEIDQRKQALEDYIAEVRKELTQSIDSLSTDLNIRITEVEDRLKEKADELSEDKLDRKEFGNLLKELGEKISS